MKELSPNTVVSVLGIGYVGLPVALACATKYITIGLDKSTERIQELREGHDSTGEINLEDLQNCPNLTFTDQLNDLKGSDLFIVTVPTPVDENNEPDLTLLRQASEFVGQVIEPGATVIFESTVFPGATEEICIPTIESWSGLALNKDFWVGYSPERINPGDKTHRLNDVIKVTSGSCDEAADFVDEFYRSIVDAGTYRAPSIRVAEAAKVIENIQRDINIALVNEFSQLFDKLNIDTGEVLETAGTKWNFLPFRPGLVGGHCIGVDPYYLTHKAREAGFHPEMILAGRKINNGMPEWIADKFCDLLTESGRGLDHVQILVLGITFKENCPDTRNSKSIELVRKLRSRKLQVDVFDPVAASGQSNLPDDIELIPEPKERFYDGLVLTVAHEEFTKLGHTNIVQYGTPSAVIFDIKHMLPKSTVNARL